MEGTQRCRSKLGAARAHLLALYLGLCLEMPIMYAFLICHFLRGFSTSGFTGGFDFGFGGSSSWVIKGPSAFKGLEKEEEGPTSCFN